MRRGSLSIVAFVAAVMALPGVAGAQTPGQDSVTGTATWSGLNRFGPASLLFNFDAHSGPSGANPTGTATVEGTLARVDISLGGPITCLTVAGSAATIGTTATTPTGAVFFSVVDGGAGPDTVGFTVLLGGPPPTVCPIDEPPGINFGPFTMDSGDITVHDAPALPTSKEQCKDGGWRNFPQFENQGDCVSFLATGGKNPPAGDPSGAP